MTSMRRSTASTRTSPPLGTTYCGSVWPISTPDTSGAFGLYSAKALNTASRCASRYAAFWAALFGCWNDQAFGRAQTTAAKRQESALAHSHQNAIDVARRR